MVDVRTYNLKNGCKILVRPTPDKQILSIIASVRWGGRDDAAEIAGRSHLMARLLTKGTRSRTAVQIAEAMESVGGSIDAFCGHDSLGLETRTVEADWLLALEILSDCLFQPTFDPSEFEKERAVVQAEIRRAEDEKFSFTYRNFQRLFYRGHSYEHPSEGEAQSVGALTREAIQGVHACAVRADRILLVVVGNVPEDAFVSEVEKRWPASSATIVREAPPRAAPLAAPGAGSGEFLRLTKDVEQGFVVVGYLAPPVGTPESSALRVACGVLGEGMSSRLFSRLRDRDHLAYAVHSMLVARELASHLVLYIGTKPETVGAAREGLLREAAGVAEETVGEKELDRAKRYILGTHLIARQTNSALARSMSSCELMGLGWEWGECFPERINAVTAESARDAARQYLANPAIVTLEPPATP